MPAVTVSQLQAALANSSHNSTNFVETGGSFLAYANELGPRLYRMGPWPDLMVERSYSAADGYISLERDITGVWAANVNNAPQRVRSLFHDLRTLGNTTFLPEKYGLVDLGSYPVRRELGTIQQAHEVADITPVTSIALTDAAGTAIVTSTIPYATITVVGYNEDGVPVTGVLTASGDATPVSTIEFAEGITSFESIQGSDLPFEIQLRTDADDAATMLATLGTGTDVSRYRRWRVGGARSDTWVHLLVKRAWRPVSLTTDLIYLGNLTAWKHAMLAKVAEDNGDVDQRAPYHWKQCFEALNDELKDHTGAATPQLNLDIWGGAAVGMQAQY